MKITERQYAELMRQFRPIGLFHCRRCKTYFELSASRPGLSACPTCGAPEGQVLSVKAFAHDDNDLDDDFD